MAAHPSATRVEFDKALINLCMNLLGQLHAIDDAGNFRALTVREILAEEGSEEEAGEYFHGDWRAELPKTDPGYYFRPHKTILVRTVADGGQSEYFCGPHRATLPALWRQLKG